MLFRSVSQARYFNAELLAVPFENIVGGPLTAAVLAQNACTKNLINFIKTVGFTPPTTMMSPLNSMTSASGSAPSSTPKPTSAPGGSGGGSGGGGMASPTSLLSSLISGGSLGKVSMVTFEYSKENKDGGSGTARLLVPFLCMVPIPFIKIKSLVYQFNVNLSSQDWESHSSNTSFQGTGVGWCNNRPVWNATISAQSGSTQGGTLSREYSLSIKIQAKNDDLPGGLDRLLTILQKGVIELAEEKEDLATNTNV